MLKKNFLGILLVCLLLITTITFPAMTETKFIGISTGSMGGTFYPVGVILANTFNEELKEDIGYEFSAHVSGGSAENLEMIRNKEIEMIIVGAVPAAQAYLGIGYYEGKDIKNTRFITALWPEAEQTVYRKGIGIKTFADFKGRKICVGPAGGGGSIYLPIVLKELAGLTYDDFSPQYLGAENSGLALQNRLIDVAYLGGRFPVPAISQIFAGKVPVDIIEITDEEFAKIKKVAPFFARITIPKGTYPNQDRDLKVYGVKSSLIAEENLDDNIVYKILEIMYIKRIDSLGKQHSALECLSLNEAMNGLSGVPLHPGAVKFYRDHGIEVPDSLIPPEMK